MSYNEEYMTPRIQSGEKLHRMVERGRDLLVQMDFLKSELLTHRQLVVDNTDNIFQNPGDLDGVTVKLVELRNALQAFANSL